MTTDNLKLAREWARDNIERGYFQDGERVMAAAEVIRDLPDTIVDGDKLRDIIKSWSTSEVNQANSREIFREIKTLLPTPAPRAEIRLGNWAMHPEHGKVLILSEHIDRDGEVCITWEGLESFHSEIGRWVPAADLSPLSDTDTETPTEQEPRVLTSDQDYWNASPGTKVKNFPSGGGDEDDSRAEEFARTVIAQDELIRDLRAILRHDEEVMERQAKQIRRVQQAVLDTGIHPDYHRRQLDHLRASWPTLHRAVMEMANFPRTVLWEREA